MVLRFMYSVLCVLFIVICPILPRQIWFDFHKEVDALKVAESQNWMLPSTSKTFSTTAHCTHQRH